MNRAFLIGLLTGLLALAACNDKVPAQPEAAAATAVSAEAPAPAPAAPVEAPEVVPAVAAAPAAAQTLTAVELPPITAPAFDYPSFVGDKVAIIHTENVIAELEDCG